MYRVKVKVMLPNGKSAILPVMESFDGMERVAEFKTREHALEWRSWCLPGACEVENDKT